MTSLPATFLLGPLLAVAAEPLGASATSSEAVGVRRSLQVLNDGSASFNGVNVKETPEPSAAPVSSADMAVDGSARYT